ncbi:MAG: hypothetical protein JO061_05580 [Acidobacteriaceae bacterium]|nr:hypothetical protein [Acidobacteriaceae bacterium]
MDHSLHLDTLHEGVTCDHCHNNAAAHLQAISHGKLIPLPPKLKGLGAEDVSSFCGQCHRTWGTVVRNHWFGEMNVRFQPYRLANSKCFDGTDQRISCVACHDPHQQLVVNQSTYDTKCFACHANVSSSAAKAKAPACPVAKSNCASCHMPKVSLPGGHQIFTDHDIRVVKADEPYPN